MDKETLSHYGWIVVLILILSCMLAFSTPFGMFVADGFKATTAGLFKFNQSAWAVVGTPIPDQDFEDPNKIVGGTENDKEPTPEPEEYIPSATFTDGITLSWEDLKKEENGIKYGYSASKVDEYSLAASAFEDCSTLVSIIFPSEIKVINAKAFKNCTALQTVYFKEGSNMSTIKDEAFYYCKSLTGFSFPSSVTAIGKYAFFGCDAFETLEFGENIQLDKIEEYTFAYCKELKTFELPSSVKSIGTVAFAHTALNKVTIKEDSQLTFIDRAAFGYCKFKSIGPIGSGASIEIPSNVTNIENAFWFNTSLSSVDFGANSKLTKIASDAFFNCVNLKTIIIPETVTIIKDEAFKDCYELKNIVIPANVTSIEDYAFAYCKKLETVTFGANSQLKAINQSAFQSCDSLKTITIPSGVEKINKYTFSHCTSIETIYLPSSLTHFDISAISNCNNVILCCEDPMGWVTNSGEAIDENALSGQKPFHSHHFTNPTEYLTKG